MNAKPPPPENTPALYQIVDVSKQHGVTCKTGAGPASESNKESMLKLERPSNEPPSPPQPDPVPDPVYEVLESSETPENNCKQ